MSAGKPWDSTPSRSWPLGVNHGSFTKSPCRVSCRAEPPGLVHPRCAEVLPQLAERFAEHLLEGARAKERQSSRCSVRELRQRPFASLSAGTCGSKHRRDTARVRRATRRARCSRGRALESLRGGRARHPEPEISGVDASVVCRRALVVGGQPLDLPGGRVGSGRRTDCARTRGRQRRGSRASAPGAPRACSCVSTSRNQSFVLPMELSWRGDAAAISMRL